MDDGCWWCDCFLLMVEKNKKKNGRGGGCIQDYENQTLENIIIKEQEDQ